MPQLIQGCYLGSTENIPQGQMIPYLVLPRAMAQQGKWLSTPASDPSMRQTAAPALAPNIKALASSGFVAFSVLRNVGRGGRRTGHILCGSHTIHLGQSGTMFRSCFLKLGSQK